MSVAKDCPEILGQQATRNIKDAISRGELQPYYFNGKKKFGNDRKSVFVKLNDIRELF